MSQTNGYIRISGASQNNLKAIDVDIPLNSLVVVTGVSGSGKSSLSFDTLYAEGQRRYVETFSPYARQFLDRMDRPKVRKIDRIPPAIAINQTNPIRTSRSTVGTMTELTDYMKLLFARSSTLRCRSCGRDVRPSTPHGVFHEMLEHSQDAWCLIGFIISFNGTVSSDQMADVLRSQGFRRIYQKGRVFDLERDGFDTKDEVIVILDRVIVNERNRSRIIDSVEQAFRFGKGEVVCVFDSGEVRRFSTTLHCPYCKITFPAPSPALFSFNSPVGACPVCHGFGKVIDIDLDLVVPDKSLSLQDGAIKPWTTDSYREAFTDLLSFCRSRGIPLDVPYNELSPEAKQVIIEGEGWFYGVRGFFRWLEQKRYKMHIRILLSKYRRYVTCSRCRGTRFQDDTLLFRLGGLTIAELYALPVSECSRFFDRLSIPFDAPARLLSSEIKTRLRALIDVGLEYLTLDRQSRTLSGGEVERVSLITALGSGLVNTLYVLDEPSIGLHPRDTNRLIKVLQSLRDRGNTIVVVEHDQDVIRLADVVVDLGPGAGEKGGEVVAIGPPRAVMNSRSSLTGQYLSGRDKVPLPLSRRRPDLKRTLKVFGVTKHNLKGIDVSFPIGLFVCVTGVSGSGKSTLVYDVLYNALSGKTGEEDKGYEKIEGAEFLRGVVMVDQSPLGRTGRANPATYVKAFDHIRKFFSSLEGSRKRGYTPSTFSFNAPGGRCEECQGAGYEVVEMQFLSDVAITCPVCKGKRFQDEVLEVRYKGVNIADVLNMTVEEAGEFFDSETAIPASLRILQDVGLGYIKLGQPLTQLSVGEAQRLKLAGHISKGEKGDTLFLFDEPTTGLHPEDVKLLISCLQRLVSQGNTVIVIEHNLDLIKCADYCIDLGPEGGPGGGEVVGVGTPDEIMKNPRSHTGRYLKQYLGGSKQVAQEGLRIVPPKRKSKEEIEIVGAGEHNLKDLKIKIPLGKMVVITGVSGSGKSTLAFDVLFSEGQRRYLDTLSAYARQYVKQLARPKVDHIKGIPPTVAIEQRMSQAGRRSTVSTITEVYHFLRLLYARLGVQFCPRCNIEAKGQTKEEILKRIMTEYQGARITLFAPLIRERKGFYRDLAEWARKRGFRRLRVDGRIYSPEAFPDLSRYKEHSIDVLIDEVDVRGEGWSSLRDSIDLSLRVGDGTFFVVSGSGLGPGRIFSTKRVCPTCGCAFHELDPRVFSFNSRYGWCRMCSGLGVLEGEGNGEVVCPSCFGKRLNEVALSVRIADRNIAEFTALTIDEAVEEVRKLHFVGEDEKVSRPILNEILTRLGFLQKVGLSYLSLNRAGNTLSTGEIQRVRLAAQLGSNLYGVCYVLDEPTIGLHPRDTEMLLSCLDALKKRGNTVVVVEHDEMTIRHSDYIIDLGPGAGASGGKVVAKGGVEEIIRVKGSVTGRYLRSRRMPKVMKETKEVREDQGAIQVINATKNNLKGITVRFPIGRFICVTGVSGAGKSTLVRDVLYQGLKVLLSGGRNGVPGCEAIKGWECLDRVVEVDQTPIGRTPRSIPATYVGFFTEIRRLFSLHPDSRVRGFGQSRFSFNVSGGRCENCKGEGRLRVEMSFLPHVVIECEVCEGKRYNEETLKISYNGMSISDVLNMTVDEAAQFFSHHSKIRRPLEFLQDVGLGYITLGQLSPTLSGGEAQRIKIASELTKTSRGRTLYVLEEPTIGLHAFDIERLITVLRRLALVGNTIIVIEHNLDVIRSADYIIDLGPEGGDRGGQVVVEGPPSEVMRHPTSYTARFLRRSLSPRRVDVAS